MKHTYFTADQETWLRVNFYCVGSYAELTDKFNATFGTVRNIGMVRDKCCKRMGLKNAFNSSKYGTKPKEQCPIATIRKSQTGTYIKVADSANKGISGYKEPYWLPLQKKIYQDAYGELAPGKMVCFLDGNQQNFDLDNLYPIDRKILAVMAKNRWWTKDKELTLAAIKWCELYYAIRNLKDGD